ncbi:tyrosine-type recombinase/integrase [Catenuloplanes atrovinosus]|uniref:Site-specific recombinase XerD n=1 Tax=Catenuloplanes atrovinosus TaxID=137266 RepID=A0AAE3YP12_9ACTN|nr:tyrosine-type recombinase/integrase [Catenuloplanes atrovinosus]MDR7276017.1 site-specific recombinase XerD [Catenuloplanes atrovinosus]
MTDLQPTGQHVPVPGQARQSALADRMHRVATLVAALPGLPADDGTRYGVRRLTAAWLLEAESPHTEKAYGRDLSTFLHWCATERLDPLTVRPTDLGQFRTWRAQHGYDGRPAAASTVARALAAVASWYTHLIANSDGLVRHNPVATVKRPKVNQHTSPTAGLTMTEVDALLAAADAQAASRAPVAGRTPTGHARYLAALRDRALLRLLADLGLRISEALDRNLDDLSHNAGHRTLRYRGKGNLPRERPLPAHTLQALDEYLTARAACAGTSTDRLTGPLFATTGAAGDGRLAEPNVFLTIRRLAGQAGIPSAGRLSPHSLRHAFATGARDAGVPLEDVQDAMGHADPRTTRRYDRDRHNIDRDPAFLLGARRASRTA